MEAWCSHRISIERTNNCKVDSTAEPSCCIMVVGITAGDLLLVVEHTFIVMDNSEVAPFNIFALIGLVASIGFSIELVSIVGAADITSIEGRIVGPILEFSSIAGRMEIGPTIVVVGIDLVEHSRMSMRL